MFFCEFSCLNCFRISIKQNVEAVLKELFHVSQKTMCFTFVIIVKKPENKQTKIQLFMTHETFLQNNIIFNNL